MVGRSATVIPRTAQQGQEMQNFIEANQADLVAYIAQTACPAVLSAVGAAAGVPAPPQVSGILCTLAASFLGKVIDKCADPARKNREFRRDFDATLTTVAQNIPALPAPPIPSPEQLPIFRWARAVAEWENSRGEAGHEMEATWQGSFSTFLAVAPLVLPAATEITLRWALSAGAGGTCEQDLALARLYGPGGQELFSREVEGVFKVGQSEAHSDTAEQVLALPAGNYLLVAAVSGPSGHATLQADYWLTEVTITRETPGARSPIALGMMALGVWLLLGGGRS